MPDSMTGSFVLGLLRDPGCCAAIAARLEGLRARHADAPSPQLVAEVVEAVLAGMRGAFPAPEAAILAEVEALGRTIAQARNEIAELRMDDITAAFIPSAADQLDAIVDATAAATNRILDGVEAVERVAEAVPPLHAEALRRATTRIYEACSFQDITGQRVTKVVATLKIIEGRVGAIMATFGQLPAEDRPAPAAPDAPGGPGLLDGPQLPGGGVSQASVDALFD